jgi:hypothetical protein
MAGLTPQDDLADPRLAATRRGSRPLIAVILPLAHATSRPGNVIGVVRYGDVISAGNEARGAPTGGELRGYVVGTTPGNSAL